MDMALVRQLFENTIAGSEALGVDPDFRAKLQATLPKLLPFHVGSQGQLQEWAADFKEWEPTHRHASHLVSVSELNQITSAETRPLRRRPRLEDLRKTGDTTRIKRRYGLGCSKGIRLWRRSALTSRRCTIHRPPDSPNSSSSPSQSSRFLRSHLAAAIAACLLRTLRPTGPHQPSSALPSAWASGEILGLRARGDTRSTYVGKTPIGGRNDSLSRRIHAACRGRRQGR